MSTLKNRILIVDGHPEARLRARTWLEARGYEIEEADSGAAALERLRADVPDVVLLDEALGDGTALDVIRAMKGAGTDGSVIVLADRAALETGVAAIREGAEHFLPKPADMAALAMIIDRVIERRQDVRRVSAMRAAAAARVSDPLSGATTAMRLLARDARSAADADTPVLIEGEAGSGKRALARWIHRASARAGEPFVALNCAGLPGGLLEAGALESAHRGTVFLDAIGELATPLQRDVLHVIEGGRIRGEGRARRVDIRLIAATDRSLAALVDPGAFGEDLFFRISTTILRVPPLRERREDIPALARQLLARIARDAHRREPALDADAERALVDYGWPGNVRELRNVLERALLLGDATVLRAEDLRLAGPLAHGGAVPATLKDLEWQHILRALADEGNNVPRAAQRLGIPRSTLYQRLKARAADRGTSRR